jgi:hypothetical protein
MSSVRNPDLASSRGSDRTVRVLMVAGVAALVGTIAGGFSVFAIVTALNAPPRQQFSADGSHTTSGTLVDGPVIKEAPAPLDAPPVQAPDASAAARTQRPAQAELTPSVQSERAPPLQADPRSQAQGVPSAQPPEPQPDALSSRVTGHRTAGDRRPLSQSAARGAAHQSQPQPLLNYSPSGRWEGAQATKRAGPREEQTHRRRAWADVSESPQVRTPPTALPPGRLRVPPGRSPAYADRYDRRDDAQSGEPRSQWRGRDHWGERDEWSERGRWGGGFFGRDTWRGDSHE